MDISPTTWFGKLVGSGSRIWGDISPTTWFGKLVEISE